MPARRKDESLLQITTFKTQGKPNIIVSPNQVGSINVRDVFAFIFHWVSTLQSKCVAMPSCENWRMFTWCGGQCDGYREPVSTLWGVMRLVTVLWHSSHSPSPGFVCPSQSSHHTSHRMQTLGSLNKTGTSHGGPSASTPHPDPGNTSHYPRHGTISPSSSGSWRCEAAMTIRNASQPR